MRKHYNRPNIKIVIVDDSDIVSESPQGRIMMDNYRLRPDPKPDNAPEDVEDIWGVQW